MIYFNVPILILTLLLGKKHAKV